MAGRVLIQSSYGDLGRLVLILHGCGVWSFYGNATLSETGIRDENGIDERKVWVEYLGL